MEQMSNKERLPLCQHTIRLPTGRAYCCSVACHQLFKLVLFDSHWAWSHITAVIWVTPIGETQRGKTSLCFSSFSYQWSDVIFWNVHIHVPYNSLSLCFLEILLALSIILPQYIKAVEYCFEPHRTIIPFNSPCGRDSVLLGLLSQVIPLMCPTVDTLSTF